MLFEVSGGSISATQSSGMTIPESLYISLLGMVIIMCILALLMAIIYVMGKVVKKFTKTPVIEAQAPASIIVKEYAEGSCGEMTLIKVDDKTAAMLMAIVADKMQIPVNELKFISIKEIKGE